MADDDLWTAADHDNDQARLYPVTGCGSGSDACVAGLQLPGAAIHLTSEDLARLVRAAAPLAGLTVDESAERFAVDMRFQALRAAVDMSAQRIDFRVANAEEAERLDIPGQVLADTVRYHRWLTDGEVPA